MKYKYSLSKDMNTTKNTFPFIGVFAVFMLAIASASCMKEVPDMQVVSQPSDAITFGVDDSFTAEVQTKATEVTSLSSFYVTAVTGSAGSESSVWNSVQFSQVAGSSPATYAGNKYWPASNPSYKFYGSNIALNYAAGGTYVNASNATDVVCAYLSSPTYNTKNTLTFEHIFARLCRVDIVAASGYTLSNISLRITPKTGGTYNLRTKEWSSVATGTATTIASSTGANYNDIFCVPGIYSITASWVARDASGVSVTHTNEVCNVTLTSGKTNNISCVLGGDITFGVVLQDYADYNYRDNLDYLTFYCDEAGTIGWKCSNASIARTIQYSKDFGATWTDLTSTTSGATVSVNAGDIVWFKGSNTEYANSYNYNTITLSNKAHVYGNVNSLTGNNTSVSEYCFYRLLYNCSNLYTYKHKKIVLPATTLASNCYERMFYGCTSLTIAPDLPATTLANFCYGNMFYGCTSLTTAPELPATTLADYCYYSMFQNCISLTAAPELPATTLASGCYQGMFRGCTSLIIAPELPATTLADYCYSNMFYGCSSLNYIKALFTTTPSSASFTTDWVYGVAPTGTFVKSNAATWNVIGNYGVPTGWTVMTEREAYLANGHAFVDLGLRNNGNKILFATMNVGASAPQEYGDYFAWGETSKRYTSISGSSVVGGSFEWYNCPYHSGDDSSTGFTKYIPTGRESYSESGVADNKLTLEAGDDVASVLWGGYWRMPDESDLEYLTGSNVTRTWTNNYNGTGVAGFIFTGNGSFSSASLFLPAAGYCNYMDLYSTGSECLYWSRSLCTFGPNRISNAITVVLADYSQDLAMNDRYLGLSVRPVLDIPE